MLSISTFGQRVGILLVLRFREIGLVSHLCLRKLSYFLLHQSVLAHENFKSFPQDRGIF